ncbi:MAG: hypothetical protein U1A27_09960 [Phycisphaerae bacterium]
MSKRSSRAAGRSGRGTRAKRAGLGAWTARTVVLDTQGPMIYVGTLERVEPAGFWLVEADVHDRHDGHASKEQYVCERGSTARANRARVFVQREVVVSLSLLDDVIAG